MANVMKRINTLLFYNLKQKKYAYNFNSLDNKRLNAEKGNMEQGTEEQFCERKNSNNIGKNALPLQNLQSD